MAETPRPIRARDKYVRPVVVEKLNRFSSKVSRQPLAARPTAWALGALARVAPKNDLYHHYRALNLDILGLDPEETESEYRRALALNPHNPWWHSRYISFLVIRGRVEDARAAWDRALELLVAPDRPPEVSLYRDLHLEVARVLLHRTQLEFARLVLDHVPEGLRHYLSSYEELRERLDVLTAAEEYGAFVPQQYLRREWWRHGPFVVPREADGRALHHWTIGRVEAASDDLVALHMAEVPADPSDEAGQPEVANTTVRRGKLRDWGVPNPEAARVDDFLEVGFYGSLEPRTTRAALHPRSGPAPQPELFPDPNRYG